MDTLLFLAFSAGLFGGFGHCIGMCGPIAAAAALPVPGGRAGLAALKPQLIYSAGRVTTYAFVGALMGLTGTFVDTAGRLAGLQNLVAVLAGLFMIAAGLRLFGFLRLPRRAGVRGGGGLSNIARLIMEEESVWRYYPLGILLGFLPCGLSYTLFIGAAGSGGLLPGMATMISFGIGTLPAMLLFGSLVTFLGNRFQRRFTAAGGIAVILMGMAFLAKGVGLYG